jgi:hypothetical protein
MRKLTTDEQRWLDEYIRDEFGLDNAGAGISNEMKNVVYESFEFQRYLLGIYWKRLCDEVTTSFGCLLGFFKLHK